MDRATTPSADPFPPTGRRLWTNGAAAHIADMRIPDLKLLTTDGGTPDLAAWAVADLTLYRRLTLAAKIG